MPKAIIEIDECGECPYFQLIGPTTEYCEKLDNVIFVPAADVSEDCPFIKEEE